MRSIESMSRKVAVVLIYFLLWLSSFQIKEVIIHPTYANLENVFFAMLAGFLFAYGNGFELFRWTPKKPEDKT